MSLFLYSDSTHQKVELGLANLTIIPNLVKNICYAVPNFQEISGIAQGCVSALQMENLKFV